MSIKRVDSISGGVIFDLTEEEKEFRTLKAKVEKLEKALESVTGMTIDEIEETKEG